MTFSTKPNRDADNDNAALIKALTSPVRRRILDLLQASGPSKVGFLAEKLEVRTGSISHHIAILEAAGLVEEHVSAGNDQRERWWKKVERSVSYSGASGNEDESDLLRELASRVDLDHKWEMARKWSEQAPEHPEWSKVSYGTSAWLRLTPEQLQAFADEYQDLVAKWSSDQSPEATPVYVFAHGFPYIP